jgi:Glycosyltransferase 61
MFQRVTKLLQERRIPYAISRRMSRNPEKSWFWKMARCLYSQPSQFHRITGCFPLPVQTVQFDAFDYQTFAEVERVPANDVPPCPHAENDWTAWTTDLPEHLRDAGIPSCHIVQMPHGYADAQGNVFSQEGKLVIGASLAARNDVNAYYTPSRIHPPVFRDTQIAALTTSQQDNYYHWMMEVLPRIAMLRLKNVPVKKFYIQQKSRFQKETLQLLNLDDSQIIAANQYDIVRSENLTVPFHEIKAGKKHPDWVSRFLRETFLPLVPASENSTSARKRLYVSRAGAAWRSVINEDEVMQRLAPLGFVKTTLDGLSVLEQVKLFSQAECVIAPHGAALANLVFSPPGTKVIEFLPRKLQDTYYRLCRTNQLPYYYIKSCTGPEKPVNNQQHLTIDQDDLTQALHWASLI